MVRPDRTVALGRSLRRQNALHARFTRTISPGSVEQCNDRSGVGAVGGRTVGSRVPPSTASSPAPNRGERESGKPLRVSALRLSAHPSKTRHRGTGENDRPRRVPRLPDGTRRRDGSDGYGADAATDPRTGREGAERSVTTGPACESGPSRSGADWAPPRRPLSGGRQSATRLRKVLVLTNDI